MVAKDIEQASQKLAHYRPRKKWYRRFVKRSAVALILRDTEAGIEALMIKRADHQGDPWSGHMAFPGGKKDPDDPHSLHTARRETLEEIGLDTEQHTRYLGRLSDVLSRSRRGPNAMVITPYLFIIEQVPKLRINHEVAEVIWVPLSFLADKTNRQQMEWQIKNMTLNLPCYFYRERRIWGLSLMMLDELVGAVKK